MRVFQIKLKSHLEQPSCTSRYTHSLSKSSEAFPVKSAVVNPKLLIEDCDTSQSDGVTIHVGKYDEPILIKSSTKLRADGNEIAGVAPIRSNDA